MGGAGGGLLSAGAGGGALLSDGGGGGGGRLLRPASPGLGGGGGFADIPGGTKAPLGGGGIDAAALPDEAGAGGGGTGPREGGGTDGLLPGIGKPGALRPAAPSGLAKPRSVFWRGDEGGTPGPTLGRDFFARPSKTSKSDPPLSLISGLLSPSQLSRPRLASIASRPAAGSAFARVPRTIVIARTICSERQVVRDDNVFGPGDVIWMTRCNLDDAV